MPCIEKGTNIRHVLHQALSISALPEHPFFGDDSVAQLVASMSGVVLGGVVEVVGSNLARGKIFTASIGSVDSLYPSIYIYIYIYICVCVSHSSFNIVEYYMIPIYVL